MNKNVQREDHFWQSRRSRWVSMSILIKPRKRNLNKCLQINLEIIEIIFLDFTYK